MRNWVVVLLMSVLPLSVLGQEPQSSPAPQRTPQQMIFAGERELSPVEEFKYAGPKQPCGKYFYGLQEGDQRGVAYVYAIGNQGLGGRQYIQNVWVYLDDSKKRPTAEHLHKDKVFLVEIRISSEDYKLASCLPPPKVKQEVSGLAATD